MLYRRRVPLLAVVCLLSAPLSATVLVPAEFREIVNGSEIIAFGRVVDATADWSGDRSRIVTFVTMEVSTYLKGNSGDTIVFAVPGGLVGRYRNVLVGAPIFEAGDEAVVFLKRQGDGLPSIFGLNQGVFRVRFDERSNRRLVVPPALMGRTETAQRVVRGAADRKSVPLETFGAQVQTVLSEAGGAR